jgi:dienelactone hydrolase
MIRFLRVTDLRSADNHAIPAYLFLPESPRGGAAVVHGYGGCKEQMLGISARLAEEGWASLAIDIRGHGEHPRIWRRPWTPYDATGGWSP